MKNLGFTQAQNSILFSQEVLKNRAVKIALVKEFIQIASLVKRRSERLNKMEESEVTRDKARVVELLSKRRDKQFEASRNCKVGCRIQDKIELAVHPIKGKNKGHMKKIQIDNLKTKKLSSGLEVKNKAARSKSDLQRNRHKATRVLIADSIVHKLEEDYTEFLALQKEYVSIKPLFLTPNGVFSFKKQDQIKCHPSRSLPRLSSNE